MGTTVSSTANNPSAAGNSPQHISPPPPQSIGEPMTTMSLDYESQAQDDLGHESLMGLQELDTHLSLLDTETSGPKDQIPPVPTSPITSTISIKNDVGIQSSIEPTSDDALLMKSFSSTEVPVSSINGDDRPRKILKTSKYVLFYLIFNTNL